MREVDGRMLSDDWEEMSLLSLSSPARTSEVGGAVLCGEGGATLALFWGGGDMQGGLGGGRRGPLGRGDGERGAASDELA